LLRALKSPHIILICNRLTKRQYNFQVGINYKLKQAFGNNEILPSSKVIGYTPYLIRNNRYVIFLVTKNRDQQRSTYENIYIALMNLKHFCEEHKLNKLGNHDELE